MTQFERNHIASLVQEVWGHNRPDASDRSVALSMLLSNFEAIEEKRPMLYLLGNVAPDRFTKAAEAWNVLSKEEKPKEFEAVLAIVNGLEW